VAKVLIVGERRAARNARERVDGASQRVAKDIPTRRSHRALPRSNEMFIVVALRRTHGTTANVHDMLFITPTIGMRGLPAMQRHVICLRFAIPPP